jgi:hypothetical protein
MIYILLRVLIVATAELRSSMLIFPFLAHRKIKMPVKIGRMIEIVLLAKAFQPLRYDTFLF